MARNAQERLSAIKIDVHHVERRVGRHTATASAVSRTGAPVEHP